MLRDLKQDFGVVHLSQPFGGNLNLFALNVQADLDSFPSGAEIGVVGYPGKGLMNENRRGLEQGAKMYMLFVGRSSARIHGGRLKYRITTFPGKPFHMYCMADLPN